MQVPRFEILSSQLSRCPYYQGSFSQLQANSILVHAFPVNYLSFGKCFTISCQNWTTACFVLPLKTSPLIAKISLSAELTTDRGWKCQLICWQLLRCAPPPECQSPSPQLCLHTSVHHQAVVRFLSDSSNKTEIERGHDTVFCWQLLPCEIARLKVKCLHTQENTGTQRHTQAHTQLAAAKNSLPSHPYYVHFSSHMWDDIHKSSCLDEPALLISPQLLFQIKRQATNYL